MHGTQEIAARLGVSDVFALRRVSDEQFVNLAGVGRGEGWAGNISITPDREPLVTEALSTGQLVRYKGSSTRVFGPYWAAEATLMFVGDFVVILGGEGVTDIDDEDLMGAAGDIAWSVGDVSAEKRLADELELTKTALTVASLPVGDIADFLANLADAAIGALSCEFGAVVLQKPERHLVIAPAGWQPDATPDLVLGSLLQLLATIDLNSPQVSQDLRNDPLAQSPLGFDDGLVSRCVIPLDVPSVQGAIVVAHTMLTSPRGFTNLCQQVAASIGEQASRVLANSFPRAKLRRRTQLTCRPRTPTQRHHHSGPRWVSAGSALAVRHSPIPREQPKNWSQPP